MGCAVRPVCSCWTDSGVSLPGRVDALELEAVLGTSCTRAATAIHPPFIWMDDPPRRIREQTEYAGPEPLMAAMDRAGSQ